MPKPATATVLDARTKSARTRQRHRHGLRHAARSSRTFVCDLLHQDPVAIDHERGLEHLDDELADRFAIARLLAPHHGRSHIERHQLDIALELEADRRQASLSRSRRE